MPRLSIPPARSESSVIEDRSNVVDADGLVAKRANGTSGSEGVEEVHRCTVQDMHRSRIALIVIDTPKSEREAVEAFWSGLTGSVARTGTRYPEYTTFAGEALLVQAVGDEPRYHLDIHTDNLDAECDRLRALGAVETYRQDDWVTFRAPGGHLLCVVGVPADDDTLNGATEWPS
jgi:hypothetical protein